MGKLFGILFIVTLVWVGLEVFTEGVGGAFGGLFTRIPGVEASEPAASRSTMERARGSVERSYEESEQRYDRLLGE
jgi:hypothetical protein